jgi:hypothetical protein
MPGGQPRFTIIRSVSLVVSLTVVLVVFVVPFPSTESYNETYPELETYAYNKTLQRAVRQDRGPGKPPNIMRSAGMTVHSGETDYTKCWIEPYGDALNLVWGTVTEEYGYQIDFYIFDQENYDAWTQNESCTPCVSLIGVQSTRFEFPLDHPGDYYIVARNRFTQTRYAGFSLVQSWQEEATAQRVVNRTRTVQNRTSTTLAERWFR